jgi:hypothetical protein
MINRRIEIIRTCYPTHKWLKKKHQDQLNQTTKFQPEDQHNPFIVSSTVVKKKSSDVPKTKKSNDGEFNPFDV